MTTQAPTRTTFPTGIALALFGAVAIVTIGFAAFRMNSDGSDGSSSNTGSALAPSIVSQEKMSPGDQLNAEMKQHEDLTTNVFGVTVVTEKTLDQQIAEAVAQHENSLQGLGW